MNPSTIPKIFSFRTIGARSLIPLRGLTIGSRDDAGSRSGELRAVAVALSLCGKRNSTLAPVLRGRQA